MTDKTNLIGFRFGHLKIIGNAPDAFGKIVWLCKCECGNNYLAYEDDLKSGYITSCGCKDPLWDIPDRKRLRHTWTNMKSRCLNKSDKGFKHYGARGITVCDEWLVFENFYDWALKNGYKPNLTLERIDVNKDYCPENCTWVTRAMQTRNKRDTIFIECEGKKQRVIEWSWDLGLPYQIVYDTYIRKGSIHDLIAKKRIISDDD